MSKRGTYSYSDAQRYPVDVRERAPGINEESGGEGYRGAHDHVKSGLRSPRRVVLAATDM